ncbi:MAG TPA: deoxyribodipyrimidine photo-lyase [Phycisphaerales bacterium]|mgnify:CR=1 FL=1|nr:deoxyribodipyrimidine photo-lyase [Phycisphaerales bacterium]
MIQPERIERLNDQPLRHRDYVLYWMQAAQRAEDNHALERTIEIANRRGKPALVCFSLTDHFPEANLRHYAFMLDGLRQTQAALRHRKIPFVVVQGAPEKNIIQLAERADAVVTDEGYLRIQRQWRTQIAAHIDCPFEEVTANLIVPIRTASDKENFSAGTLRPRITRHLDTFIKPLQPLTLKNNRLNPSWLNCIDLNDSSLLNRLRLDRSVAPSPFYRGGAKEAQKRLELFIRIKLARYAKDRNNPLLDCQSNLSPYLHFGHISPLTVALAVLNSNSDSEGKAAFLEELVVRRELSHNFVYYNTGYDDFDRALPPWALRTLNFHAKDKREYQYSLEQLETSETHDAAWNAAQSEMMLTGKMHNYMRMYWGKKILEWTATPRQGFEWALFLNNKYELDGRDPNGYAGVAWCFGKHDRAWNERPVFGKVRYMNAAGLKRKFDVAAYIRRIENLARQMK